MIVFGLLILAYLLGNQSPTVKQSLTVPGVKQSLTTEHGHETDFMTIDPQPSPSDKKPRKLIILFSVDGCIECDKWKRCEQPKFEAAGWTVGKSDQPLKGPWPHFLIETDGKTKEKRGYFSYEQLGEVLK